DWDGSRATFLERCYYALAIGSVCVGWYFNTQYMIAYPVEGSWLHFTKMLFDNPASGSGGQDLIVTNAVLFPLWTMIDGPRRGLRVLCLEKNAYVGGMAGTREILSGCRNDVGASLLFPLAKGLADELELTRYGVEYIDLPIMATNLTSRDAPPAIFYSNPVRMA